MIVFSDTTTERKVAANTNMCVMCDGEMVGISLLAGNTSLSLSKRDGTIKLVFGFYWRLVYLYIHLCVCSADSLLASLSSLVGVCAYNFIVKHFSSLYIWVCVRIVYVSAARLSIFSMVGASILSLLLGTWRLHLLGPPKPRVSDFS